MKLHHPVDGPPADGLVSCRPKRPGEGRVRVQRKTLVTFSAVSPAPGERSHVMASA